jgi:hypothetical protein
MYPFFKNDFFDCENTILTPYWPDYDNPVNRGTQRTLMEIPVTVGFNHKNYKFMHKVYNLIAQPSLYHFRLVALFWHTQLLRKLYLSPEMTSGRQMRPLINSVLNNDFPIIHMYFHSSSLIDGATGFMPHKNAFDVICNNIRYIIEYAQKRANLHFCTMSEAAVLLKHQSLD